MGAPRLLPAARSSNHGALSAVAMPRMKRSEHVMHIKYQRLKNLTEWPESLIASSVTF
jgi:hypothetical protein